MCERRKKGLKDLEATKAKHRRLEVSPGIGGLKSSSPGDFGGCFSTDEDKKDKRQMNLGGVVGLV